jgi:hypothetical protein
MIFFKILLLNLVVVIFVMKRNINMNFQIYKITNLNTNVKNMKILLKFNPKHHWKNEVEIILEELLNNTKHMHLESQ